MQEKSRLITLQEFEPRNYPKLDVLSIQQLLFSKSSEAVKQFERPRLIADLYWHAMHAETEAGMELIQHVLTDRLRRGGDDAEIAAKYLQLLENKNLLQQPFAQELADYQSRSVQDIQLERPNERRIIVPSTFNLGAEPA